MALRRFVSFLSPYHNIRLNCPVSLVKHVPQRSIMTEEAKKNDNFVIAALYQFINLSKSDCEELCTSLRKLMNDVDVRGNLRIATEGLNGTISGTREGVDTFNKYLRSFFLERELKLEPIYKESYHSAHVFRRATVKVRDQIVSFGPSREFVDVEKEKGSYVLPKDFDEFVEKSKDLVLVDVRNDYEVEMGTFRGAINPKTDTFQDFVEFVDNKLPSEKPETPIAMFCTGGVRCEKATAFLKRKGFKNVFHLKGGILQYLQDVPENKSSWKGECYVFDRRVSVDHDLHKGSYAKCFACRTPLSKEDMTKDSYVEGVSCPYCEVAKMRRRMYHKKAS